MNPTENVVAIFEQFRMPPTVIDQYNSGGREKLFEKITPFVSQGKTIEFVMLGYPFKSTNHRDKTIGVLPDLAEEVSMQNFSRFGAAIAAVHAPGARLNIVSDGFVFNDLLEESDAVVDAYAEVTAEMAKTAPVNLLGLRDFYSGDPLSAAREKVMTQFGIADVELERRVLFDPDVNALYRGMIHFMEEELAYKEFASRNQLHKAAKRLAKQMMFRNEAYSHLVRQEFPSNIRLSMHPSANNGSKYSFQLIPSPHAWTSPWHCALLIESDGQYATIHRKDAEAAGHQLIQKGGRPYYYQAA